MTMEELQHEATVDWIVVVAIAKLEDASAKMIAGHKDQAALLEALELLRRAYAKPNSYEAS